MQQVTRRPVPVAEIRVFTLLMMSMVFSGNALAQQTNSGMSSSGAPTVNVQTRLGVNQTWTDNNLLATTAKDSALITTLTPGISISSKRGRVQGSLDYSLNGIFYTKSDQKDRVQQNLSARGTVELFENAMFVDATASIAQQTTSAFGAQSVDTRLSNPNRNETAMVSVAPRIQGRLGNFAQIELRANASVINVNDAIVGDSNSDGFSMRISGAGQSVLNWSAQASTQKTNFKASSENRLSNLNLGLTYKPDIDWQAGVLVGRERSDLKDYTLRNSATYGANASWSPSRRTKLAVDFQAHDYGDAFSYSLDHRWARAAFRFSDTQSVNVGNLQNASAPQSNYDLYFFQLASVVPDPVERDLRVRSTLRALGLSPDSIANNSLLNAGPSIQRNQLVSFSVQGVRTTVTASGSRSSSRRLASAEASAGDFSQTARIRQRGVSVDLSHSLTPTSSIALSVVQQESEGDLATQSTTLKSISASWSSRLGARTAFTLGARAANFAGLTPYREHAVFANLVQQF